MRAAAKPRPRTKPPEQRRDDLINAAERLFLERGVTTTTIEQITAQAQVAKGTFYLYFSSKEEILGALGERYGERLLASIKAAIEALPAEDWKGRLSAWAATSVNGYLDSMRLHDIAFYSSGPPTREGLVNNPIIDHLCELLQAGVEAGTWSIDDPRGTAVFLFSGMHGIVDDASIREKRVNRTRLAHRLERLCLRAVGLPGE